MVEAMRRQIEGLGGEYRWQHRVDDLELERQGDGPRKLRGGHLADGGFIETDHVWMAGGHSARPTFEMLHRRGVDNEETPFSIAVRVWNPQSKSEADSVGEEGGSR